MSQDHRVVSANPERSPAALRLMLGAALLVASSGVARAASTTERVRCEGRLVSIGDTALTLRSSCGEPDHLLVLPEVRSGYQAGPGKHATLIEVVEDVEWWTYLRSSGDWMRLFSVKGGLVRSIETLGRTPAPSTPCRHELFEAGARLGEIVLRCGEPAQTTKAERHETQETSKGLRRRIVVTHTIVYDPGPGRYLRVYSLDNGVVTATRTAERSPNAR